MKLETLQSLVELLPTYGDRPAVGLRQEFGLRWWSYRRLYDEAYRVAGLLCERGIRRGEPIVLWAPNCPEWVGFLLGAALRGAVVVPADEGSSPAYVRDLAERIDAVLVVHGPGQDVSAIGVVALSIYAAGCALAPSANLVVAVRPNDPALILYTSGTTSEPKGVILTHHNLISQMEPFRLWRWLVRVIPFRMLSLSPLSHVQGLVLGICIPLSIGLSVIYSDSVNTERMIRTIKQNRATLLVAVPRLQHLLAKALQQRCYGRNGVTLAERVRPLHNFFLRRYILRRATHAVLGYQFWVLLVGGATLSAADERFWFESGYCLVQGYGLTETAAIVSININTPFFGHIGSIGKPLAKQTICIAEDGELLVQGPNVTPGYAGDDETPAQVFIDADGLLHTGDLVRSDGSGRLYFVGRKKDIIVTGEGYNVYPREVEAILNEMPGVYDAVVLGLERDGHEEVHAVLLLDDTADAAQIIRRANAVLAPYQMIRGWRTLRNEDFPRTNLLKVKREELAASIRRRPGPPAVIGSVTEVAPSLETIQQTNDRGERLRMITRYLIHAPPERQTAEQLRLVDDLGLSSLDVVELLTLIETVSQAALPNVNVSEGVTLADLRVLLQPQRGAAPSKPRPAQQPAWSHRPVGRLLRSMVQPLVIGIWSSCCTRPTAIWPESGMDLCVPFIIMAAPHRHWLDTFVIYSALPRHMRKRLMVVTNRDAREYFAPSPDVPLSTRLSVGIAYYLLAPLLFSFAILPSFGTTRQGLYETGRLLDRGYSPITFPKGFFFSDRDAQRHDPGMAIMALQTQVPVLPVWLQGNDRLNFRPKHPRPRVTVKFGRPIKPTPSMTPDQVIHEVELAFERLS